MIENLVGQTLGRYNIVRLIAEDRLGALYKAYDPTLLRDFMIRVVSPSFASRPNFAEDFVRAARAAARLDHPNIIQVLDFGEVRSLNYIVMEYIPGNNLEQMLSNLRRSGRWIVLHEAVQVVRQLALALEYVRSQDVPQRTIKPANVMIKPVQSDRLPYLPVLTGLGLAWLFEEGRVGASADNPAAAFAYCSPEAALGSITDARSDVYSLGVLLFELTTGQLPFPVHNHDDAVRYHTRQPSPPLRSVRPDLPESLERAVLKVLEKNPENRFESPAAFANVLDEIIPSVMQVQTAPPTLESAVSLLVPYRQSILESGDMVRPPEFESPPATQTVPVTPGRERPQQGQQVEAILENPHLSVEPGSNVDAVLILRNLGTEEAAFNLSLEGVPSSWLPAPSQTVHLGPGEARNVRFGVQPPRSPQSRAGRYPLTVRVEHQQDYSRYTEAKGTLTVAAFSQFSSELYPQRLKPGEIGQITIKNLGNTPETFNITFRDTEGALAFTPPQVQLRLSEGQSGIAEFRPALRSTHLLGSDRLYPFTVQVSAAGGDTQMQSGEIHSRPLVPVWLLGLFLVVCLCAAGSLALFLTRPDPQERAVIAVTETAMAQENATLAALQATSAAETATALFLADANQATIVAATETAIWLAILEQTLTAAPDPEATAIAIATQTAAVLQVTQTFQAQQALETAQAQEATQAAVALQATQTAVALDATQAAAQGAIETATAQAAFNAATQTAEAATAQAAAIQTATAQAATQTAAVLPRFAYIYSTAPVEARDFQALLHENNFLVDLVPQDTNTIVGTDFRNYQGILIGPETGSGENWGDPGGAQVNHLITSGQPILGLGVGGYAFFGRAELVIDGENGVPADGTSILVVDPTNRVWTTPYQLQVQAGQALVLYTNPTPFIAIALPEPVPNIVLIGRHPDNPEHYPLIGRDQYLYWGFNAGPAAMTPTGQQVFVNLVRSMLPQ